MRAERRTKQRNFLKLERRTEGKSLEEVDRIRRCRPIRKGAERPLLRPTRGSPHDRVRSANALLHST